jgi:hypothetical protein
MNNTFFSNIFVKSFTITLRFKEHITFHFFHGSKIHRLIENILNWHISPKQKQKNNDIVIYSCEWIRLNHGRCSAYNFGINFNENLLYENLLKGKLVSSVKIENSKQFRHWCKKECWLWAVS